MSAKSQTCERSAISYSVSAGMTRAPATAFLVITTPATGERRTTSRAGQGPPQVGAIPLGEDQLVLRRQEVRTVDGEERIAAAHRLAGEIDIERVDEALELRPH